MIGIIDYGRGNISSVETALEKGGFKNITTDDHELLRKCDGLILPGVGAFKDGMKDLENRGLIPIIEEVVKSGKPLLGICLGLHLLFEVGEEDGESKGLGLLEGRVERLTTTFKIPHIGWNDLKIINPSPILDGIVDGDNFYFVHSYQAHPVDKSIISATCNYGQDIVAVVSKNNIFGVQFHPEKSSHKGMVLIQNFGKLVSQWS
ncbi:MAG: imidazole glycerol phosphate synthase subunit HisH [Firmicutes bacterium]|nr:imidazole glycerol phosphate synthase subunit HisH [Bacillota bacterium]